MSSYSSAVLADSPLRYYRMNETSGTVATDSSTQAQNGTYTGGYTLGQSSLLANDSGSSVLFNGSTGNMSVPTTGLPTGASAWTMMCWVLLGTLSTYQTLMEFGTFNGTSNQGVRLDYGGGYGNRFVLDNKDYSVGVQQPGSPTQGNIYFVVGTYDGATATLYVNGSSVASASVTLSIALAQATIGGPGTGDSGGAFWRSQMAQAAIFGTCLSSGQIASLYTTGITAPPAMHSAISDGGYGGVFS